MASDTTLTSDITELQKIVFDNVAIDNVVHESEFLDVLAEGQQEEIQTRQGRRVELAHLYRYPGSVGTRGEDGYIPEAVDPAAANSWILLKKMLGTLQMSADTLDKVHQGPEAFLTYSVEAYDDLLKRLINHVDSMALGTGTGIKARVNMTTPAVALVIDSAFGGAGLLDATLQFMAGDSIRIAADAAGATLRVNKAIVNSIDHPNSIINLSVLPTSTADDDYIALGDDAGNSFGNDAMGIMGGIDDGTFVGTLQNIARATNPWFNSQVLDVQATPFATGQKLTERVLIYAKMIAHQYGMGDPDVLVTSPQGVNQYWASVIGDRTVPDPRGRTEGGKSNETWIHLGGRIMRVREARKMPRNLAYLLQTSTIRRYFLNQWTWEDRTGSRYHLVTDATGRKHHFFSFGYMHWNLAFTDPQKSVALRNITNEAF